MTYTVSAKAANRLSRRGTIRSLRASRRWGLTARSRFRSSGRCATPAYCAKRPQARSRRRSRSTTQTRSSPFASTITSRIALLPRSPIGRLPISADRSHMKRETARESFESGDAKHSAQPACGLAPQNCSHAGERRRSGAVSDGSLACAAFSNKSAAAHLRRKTHPVQWSVDALCGLERGARRVSGSLQDRRRWAACGGVEARSAFRLLRRLRTRSFILFACFAGSEEFAICGRKESLFQCD